MKIGIMEYAGIPVGGVNRPPLAEDEVRFVGDPVAQVGNDRGDPELPIADSEFHACS